MPSGAAQALDALRRNPDRLYKGAQFESLSEGFLKAMYGAVDIRPVAPDLGVDRLFTDDEGNVVAAQMKCYAPDRTVKMADVNNFITEATKHKATVMVLLTTSDLSVNAAKKAADYGMTVHGFDDLVTVDCWTPAPVGVEPPLAMRPHQQAAYDAAMAATDHRGQVIMPCRTGKSLVEAELAGAHLSSLITVPTIALAAQMAADVRRQHPTRPMLLVYSGDELDKSTTMPIRATTDPAQVQQFRAAHPEHIVVSTYHSAHLLAGQQAFDMMLCDEAHRLATNTTRDNGFKVVLHDQHIAAKRRLFFTATPRVTVGSVKSRLRNQGLPVYSMDDPALFGHRLHELSWADAVEQDLILPLNLIAPLANESSLMASITGNHLTDALRPYLADAAKVRDVASVIGMLDAHTRYGVTTMLTFHSGIAKANDAERITQAVAAAMGIPIQTLTVTSESPKGHVARALAMLEPGKQTLNVVFSVQMFTEGINTPALDAVVYFEPKRSVVSIAQSLARPVTKSPEKQAAYAILPVFAQTAGDLEANIDASEWAGVKSVARALFSFGMTPEQIDVQVHQPTGVVGGNPFSFNVVPMFDTGFDLELAKDQIRAAVLRLDPALAPGQPCPVVMDDGTVCGSTTNRWGGPRTINTAGMCPGHNRRKTQGIPLGAPWREWPDDYGAPCEIEMHDGSACGKPIRLNSMCPGHARRAREGAVMGAPWRSMVSNKGEPCPVEMRDGSVCGRPIATSDNLCASHAARKRSGYPMDDPWPSEPLAGTPCPIVMDDGPCGRTITTGDMCKQHRSRQQRGDSMTRPWRKRGGVGSPCIVVMDDGTTCGRPSAARFMCTMHIQRERAGRPMGAPPEDGKRVCGVETESGPCQAKATRTGLCTKHQRRKDKGQDLWPERVRKPPRERGQCAQKMDDGTTCGKPEASGGLCWGHISRRQSNSPMGKP